MAVFAVLLLCIFLCLVLVGVGLVIAIVTLGLLALALSLGIFSSSVLVGFARKQPTTGFRAFFLQAGGFAGLLIGVAALAAFDFLRPTGLGLRSVFVFGGLCGAVSGVIVAWVFNLAWSRLLAVLVNARDRRKTGFEVKI